jgi:hypothetical protein
MQPLMMLLIVGDLVNVKRIPILIEIHFWNLSVNLLTQSSLAQSVFRWAYPYMTRVARSSGPQYVALWAGAGLALGFTVGLLAILTVL